MRGRRRSAGPFPGHPGRAASSASSPAATASADGVAASRSATRTPPANGPTARGCSRTVGPAPRLDRPPPRPGRPGVARRLRCASGPTTRATSPMAGAIVADSVIPIPRADAVDSSSRARAPARPSSPRPSARASRRPRRSPRSSTTTSRSSRARGPSLEGRAAPLARLPYSPHSLNRACPTRADRVIGCSRRSRSSPLR